MTASSAPVASTMRGATDVAVTDDTLPTDWRRWPDEAKAAFLTTNRSREDLVVAIIDELGVEPDRELNETDPRLTKEEIAAALVGVRSRD